MNQVSGMEISIIKNMMRQHGNKHIAQALELPIEQINVVVKNIYEETGIEPKQLMIDEIEKGKEEWRRDLQKAREERKQELQIAKNERKLQQQNEKAALQSSRLALPKRVKIPKSKPEPKRISKSDRAAEVYHAQRKREIDRSKFQTLKVDYNQLIQVKINPGTTLYIKPGEDPVEAKNKYLEREAIKKKKIYAKPVAGETTRRFR